MKIEKAICYIETRAKDLEFQGFDREAQALKLGIEGLKRLRQNRNFSSDIDLSPLPGETTD